MLAGFLAICLGACAFGAAFPPGEWHAALEKPSWNPPNWLFGPVWTLLYIMIATSGWLVWKREGFAGAKLAFAVFAAQLALNALWSYLFFGLHRPDLAFFNIVLLWVMIAITIMLFRRHDQLAAALLLPYLAWVTFASALNLSLWRLNS